MIIECIIYFNSNVGFGVFKFFIINEVQYAKKSIFL